MKQITCTLQGGLGNQLFQIFTVMAYAIKHEYQFVFKYSKTLNIGITRSTFWHDFLIELLPYTTYKNNNSLISQYLDRFPIYKETNFKFTEIPVLDDSCNYLSLFGYFQSYKYFHEQWEQISELIKLKQQVDFIRKQHSSLLNNYYNISMHFRIGDYKHKTDYHPILPYEYYYRALKFIDTNKTEPKQVIYFYELEDIDIVNPIIEKLKSVFPDIIFTSAPSTLPDWKQMLLMSCCHSNIIANSSFSWWGAYINQEKYFVCYPSVWFGNKANHSIVDLIPGSWCQINASV